MAMSDPHALDEVYEEFQTRVSKIRVSASESSGISITPGRNPSFRSHQVDRSLHHDQVADQINLADSFASRQHIALDLRLSMNLCMSWMGDYKFHAYDLVH